MMVEYRERVRRKYEELDADKGTVEGEWRKYKDVFLGVAEELCGRRGREVHCERETKDDGRNRWRWQWGRSMEDDRRH